MIYITLVCNLGMSTSMLTDRMVAAAKAKNIEIDVEAMPFDKMGSRINKTNVLLLGPQVRHLAKKFQDQYGSSVAVIEVMNMSDYALLKAEKIVDDSLALYYKKTNR
ncbi:PTS sugar transporter subunit IIB [Oscillospiraceae bacterium PP1C4]